MAQVVTPLSASVGFTYNTDILKMCMGSPLRKDIWRYTKVVFFSSLKLLKDFSSVWWQSPKFWIESGLITSLSARLCGLVACASDWWSGGCGFNPYGVGNILSWRFIMKYFLGSFSFFCWFSDPSIPGLVTIVLNTYFIDMMMSWVWFYRLPGFV